MLSDRRKKASPATATAATNGKVAEPEPIRILFVDDDKSIRLTLPPILETQGFEVRTAGSVAEALAEIDASAYDVLLADLNMEQEGD